MTATESARELAVLAARAAGDKHASDLTIIDVSDRLALADCFVLASGSSERQIGAIVDAVTERLAREGVKPTRREGDRDSRWVLLDFAGVVVHVQHVEERVFYALDRLWGDCPTIEIFGTDEGPEAGTATGPDEGPEAGTTADSDADPQ